MPYCRKFVVGKPTALVADATTFADPDLDSDAAGPSRPRQAPHVAVTVSFEDDEAAASDVPAASEPVPLVDPMEVDDVEPTAASEPELLPATKRIRTTATPPAFARTSPVAILGAPPPAPRFGAATPPPPASESTTPSAADPSTSTTTPPKKTTKARAILPLIQKARKRIVSTIESHQEGLEGSAKDVAAYDVLAHPVTVAFRVRPVLDEETERGLYEGVFVHNPTTYLYHPIESLFCDLSLETHVFDNVDCSFGPSDSPDRVYDTLVAPLVPFVRGGGMATVFAMNHITRRLPLDLFPAVAATHKVTVSYVEIYGDTVTDLLGDRRDLRVRCAPQGTVVIGATQQRVSSADEFQRVVEAGAENRRTRATFKNAGSSRSHAVCVVSLHRRGGVDAYDSGDDEEENPEADFSFDAQSLPDGLLLGPNTLLIVDLAGSERRGDQMHHDAVRTEETRITNQSLATLKECIRARHQHTIEAARAKANPGRRTRHVHVPFRTSKLTMILKEALDPASRVRSRTVVLGHLAPALADSEHSLNTARYVANLKSAAVAPYSHLVQRIRQWSDDAVDLTQILSYHDPSSDAVRERTLNMGLMVDPTADTAEQERVLALKFTGINGERTMTKDFSRAPVWLELYRMPLREWLQRARPAPRRKAQRAWEQYRLAVAEGRAQGLAQAEKVLVLLV
ncbi:hypothetical protein H9P43_001749 [Blastocladiella emersonii ATCC 22665]|nr:hypothetical protein H9P43_001749 [Blastocladiella emersonii ATCC 22665]